MSGAPPLDPAHVVPLSTALAEPPGAFLQVLVDALALERRAGGVRLELAIAADQPAIRDRAGKAALACARPSGGRRLAAALARFAREPDAARLRIDCSDHPLRWANGGVLPLVRADGRDRAVLFLREIEPVGWNLANGASDTVAELLDPARVARRELVEELLVVDPARRVRWALAAVDLPETPADALAAWDARLGLARFERASLSVRWSLGPDAVRVRLCEGGAAGGGTQSGGAAETAGHRLVISPEDDALEVDRVARLDLPPGAALLDGEHVGGAPLDRVVGLFDLESLRARVAAGEPLVPERAFRGGVERREPLAELAEEALADLAARGLSTEDEQRRARALPPERRFGPCPPTRALSGFLGLA